MKKSNRLSIVLFVLYIALVVIMQRLYPPFVYVLAITMAVLFLFSLLVRRNVRFKGYFTSKFNVLTSKMRYRDKFDLPKDILMDKMSEALTDAGFQVRHVDKASGNLFATSAMSFYSWGENIYLDLTEIAGVTTVDFCSACFFGATSWGRNEQNYKRLLQKFEDSLVI